MYNYTGFKTQEESNLFYFEQSQGYCDGEAILDYFLPYGVYFEAVHIDVHNGLSALGDNLFCYLLHENELRDEAYKDLDLTEYIISNSTSITFPYNGSKHILLDAIVKQRIKLKHDIKWALLGDEYILIQRIKDARYIFYYFSFDVFCPIGRFITSDLEDQIERKLLKYMDNQLELKHTKIPLDLFTNFIFR